MNQVFIASRRNQGFMVVSVLLLLSVFLSLNFDLSIHRKYIQTQPDVNTSIQVHLNDEPSSPDMLLPERVIVCITGVLGDLEMENKLTNLLLPLQNIGISVHVVFDLSDDRKDSRFVAFREPYSFTQPAHFKGGMHQGINLTPLAYTLYQSPLGGASSGGVTENPYLMNLTATRFRNFNASNDIIKFMYSKGFSKVHVKVHDPIINPPMNPDYIRALIEADGAVFRRGEIERIVWRAVNNVRSLYSYDRCWKAAMTVHNITSKNLLVIHAGDDTILDRPIVVNGTFLAGLTNAKRWSDTIISIPCQTLRGHINDQIDVFGASFANVYFTYPLRFFYMSNLFNHSTNISTLESFLQKVYSNFDAYNAVFDNPRGIVPSIDYPISYNTFVQDWSVASDTTVHGQKGLFHQVRQNQTKTKRVFVCITGQLKRLELQNKLATLFIPMLAARYRVDVAFSLSSGEASFQLHSIPGSSNFVTFQTTAELEKYLSERNEFSTISGNLTRPAFSMTPINPQFFVHILRNDVAPKTPAAKVDTRKLNHIFRNTHAITVMFESYTKCWKDAMRTGQNYEFHVRVREDVGFDRQLDTGIFSAIENLQKIIVSAYRSNGGINDRLAFVGQLPAECYYNLPFVKMFDGSYLDAAMLNSESIAKRIYWRGNCSEILMNSTFNPRKMLGGKFIDARV